MKQVGYTLARVARDLRVRLLRALMSVQWPYFISQPEGHFANAISTETYRGCMAYRHTCSALANAIQVLVYAGVMLVISWQAAMVALALGAVVAALLGRFITMSRSAGREQTGIMKSLVARLTDALKGVKAIKAMAREAPFLSVLERRSMSLERTEQRQVFAQESLVSFHEPVIALMLAIGTYAALHWGNLPASSLLVTAFLFYRLTGRFQDVQREYQASAVGESAFWSMNRILTEAEEQRELSTGTRNATGLRGEIRLDQVSFSYGEHRVLDNVSLTIPAGTLVALVGPSGAGKTTIIDLIIGLHRPDNGEIFVDGVPLQDLELRSWRQFVGYVPQETLLLHDSVYTNVALGNERASRDDVAAALRAADAWDFVARMEDGIDTVVGERGMRLSGGQRQRIAIARALLGNPAILILDEATTALDPDTEASICRTLRKLAGRVTIISISHQSAMRDVADFIYEIRNGKPMSVKTAHSAGAAAPTLR